MNIGLQLLYLIEFILATKVIDGAIISSLYSGSRALIANCKEDVPLTKA